MRPTPTWPGSSASRSSTFLTYKRDELERFHHWVTDWEFREYAYHLTRPRTGGDRVAAHALPLDYVDLTDLDAFARNQGWAMFDTLRAEDPVHWTPRTPPQRLLGGHPVRGHRAVDKDAETFTSTRYVNLEEVDDDLMDLRRSMLETDGLRHRALRKLIQREFGRAR